MSAFAIYGGKIFGYENQDPVGKKLKGKLVNFFNKKIVLTLSFSPNHFPQCQKQLIVFNGFDLSNNFQESFIYLLDSISIKYNIIRDQQSNQPIRI
jgi:hypothetical protein